MKLSYGEGKKEPCVLLRLKNRQLHLWRGVATQATCVQERESERKSVCVCVFCAKFVPFYALYTKTINRSQRHVNFPNAAEGARTVQCGGGRRGSERERERAVRRERTLPDAAIEAEAILTATWMRKTMSTAATKCNTHTRTAHPHTHTHIYTLINTRTTATVNCNLKVLVAALAI